MGRNYDLLDILTIFSVLLQVTQMQDDLKQAGNNDLLSELQKQDREYLEKILKNQEMILERLANLAD